MNTTHPTHHLPAVTNLDGIEVIRRDGRNYMTAEQIGGMLGYTDPRNGVAKIYQRNIVELQEHTTVVKLSTVDGKLRDVRVFSEEGWYIISFLADTDRAKDFRGRVAGLLRKIREKALLELNAQLTQRETRILALETEKDQAKAEGLLAGLALSEIERQRLPLLLRYQHMALTQQEIGTLLGLSLRSVEVLASKARSIGLELHSLAGLKVAELGAKAQGVGCVHRRARLTAEVRADILSCKQQGLGTFAIARQVGVSHESVRRVVSHARATGLGL